MDVTSRADKYPNSCFVLVNRGHIRVKEDCRAIFIKKPQRQKVPVSDKYENEAKASVRFIAENRFWRQSGLWAVVGTKCRWSEAIYDSIFNLTFRLNNVHIKWHPLRDVDKKYERYLKRLNEIAEITSKKRTVLKRRILCAAGVRWGEICVVVKRSRELAHCQKMTKEVSRHEAQRDHSLSSN